MREAHSVGTDVFPHDEDGRRLSRILRKVLLTSFGAPPLFVAVIAFAAPASLGRACWGLMAMPLAAAGWWLLETGRVRATTQLVVFGFWALIFTGSLMGPGVSGPGFGGFMLVIPMAGLLLGGRTGLAVAGLSAAAGVFLMFLDRIGLLPDAPVPHPVVFWLVNTLYFGVAAAVLFWAIDAIREATTRLRTNERALSDSNERLRLALDAARMGTWDWDPGTDAVVWSEHAPAILGVSGARPPATMTAYGEVVHPEDRDAFRSAVASALGDGRATVHLEHRTTAQGRALRWVSWNAQVRRDDRGQAVRVVGTLCDVTDRRALEERLLQAQKLEAIGRLAGGIAHDFNNALTAVVGYVSFAERTLEPDHAARESLSEISRAAARVGETTRGLLAFARKQRVNPTIVDVNGLVTKMERMLQRLIGERVTLTTCLAPSQPRCHVDPARLEQVLLNLAINARDAMPSGGTLCIETAATDETVSISVIDTGVGMDPETLDRLFEPFFTTKKPGEGTGLGLATCYGVIEQAGGHITVESRPQQGSRFTIVLRATPQPPALEPAPPDPGRGGSERLLVVEDEAIVRVLLERTLRDHGYSVRAVATGEEALAVAAEEGARLALLVTDVVLPGIGGRDLAERLCQQLPGLRVIFMSGYTNDAILNDPSRSRVAAVMEKPFTPAQLAARVRLALDSVDRPHSHRDDPRAGA